MIAYDLDNTLANTDYSKVFGKASMVGMLEKATVRYKPTGDFIIITARGEDAEIQRVTRTWVKENLPNCKGVYFVTGSGAPAVERKIAVMKQHGATEFADGKVSVLAEFKKQNPQLVLWHVTSTGKVKYN